MDHYTSSIFSAIVRKRSDSALTMKQISEAIRELEGDLYEQMGDGNLDRAERIVIEVRVLKLKPRSGL